jgi:uncharacterized protein with FMN-binding domain
VKRKKHTALYIILGMALALAIAGGIAYNNIRQNLAMLAATPLEYVDLSRVADGTYTGAYKVFPVAAEVEVTVKDHMLASARILSHQNGRGAQGEAVVQSAVQAGTLQVDAISGATYSSSVLLHAMRNALLQGIAP